MEGVFEAPVARGRGLECLDGVFDPVSEVALVREASQEIGSRAWLEHFGVAERLLVQRRGLAVRARRGRTIAGGRRQFEDCACVSGRGRVVSQTGQVESALGRRAERRECAPVELESPLRLDRFLDRQPRQLVTELEAVAAVRQRPCCHAFVDSDDLLDELLEQPRFRARGRDRHRVDHRPGVRAQTSRAREHGIDDGAWNLAGSGGEDLRHEERIARSAEVELVGVDADRRGELCDGRPRERWNGDALDRRSPRDLAQRDAKRVDAVELVIPERPEHEGTRSLDLAREQSQHIERRLVGPVQVFEHEHGRPTAPNQAGQRFDDLVRAGSASDLPLEFAAGLLGDIHEWPERARRRERVARTPEDAGWCVHAEVAHQGRLAGSSLARDEDQAAGARSRRPPAIPEGTRGAARVRATAAARRPPPARSCRCRQPS